MSAALLEQHPLQLSHLWMSGQMQVKTGLCLVALARDAPLIVTYKLPVCLDRGKHAPRLGRSCRTFQQYCLQHDPFIAVRCRPVSPCQTFHTTIFHHTTAQQHHFQLTGCICCLLCVHLCRSGAPQDARWVPMLLLWLYASERVSLCLDHCIA